MSDTVDEQRRRFLVTSTCAVGGLGALCAATPFISSWMPSLQAQAKAQPIQVDISDLLAGMQKTIEWRGKPVWIIHRTRDMLSTLHDNNPQLRDPKSCVKQQPAYAQNKFRSINPNYLVLIGLCTHLGCSPIFKSDGFICPCHQSQFDLSGRVFKDMPAPINLEVPPYYFLNEHTIIIGDNPHE